MNHSLKIFASITTAFFFYSPTTHTVILAALGLLLASLEATSSRETDRVAQQLAHEEKLLAQRLANRRHAEERRERLERVRLELTPKVDLTPMENELADLKHQVAAVMDENDAIRTKLEETLKVAEDAKKLGSQANLAMSFAPVRKPRTP